MYEVSTVSVYRWLYRYSPHYKRQAKQVVEMESQEYQYKALLQKVAEYERALGRKQLEEDYLNKLIEISSEELGIDIKKNSHRNYRMVPWTHPTTLLQNEGGI